MLAACNQDRVASGASPKVPRRFARVLVRADAKLRRRFRFVMVRCDERRPGVAREVGNLRIHDEWNARAGLRRAATRHRDAEQRFDGRSRHHALQIIGDEQRFGAAGQRFGAGNHGGLHRTADIPVDLVIDPRDLLVAIGDDANLLGGRS